MIIADTSVWVEHFRRNQTPLQALLSTEVILMHPFVFGELLLHGLPKQGGLATSLLNLDPAPVASPAEAAAFINWAKLMGTGIGYVDAHLIVSAKMLANSRILTSDRNLHAQAARLGIAYAS
jgi:predicted nucleic acid-binding protein